MYSLDREAVKTRFNLPLIRHLEKYVANAAEIKIPFNNFVTGSSAFTHKAGVHSKVGDDRMVVVNLCPFFLSFAGSVIRVAIRSSSGRSCSFLSLCLFLYLFFSCTCSQDYSLFIVVRQAEQWPEKH